MPIPIPVRMLGRRGRSDPQGDGGAMRSADEAAGLSGFALIVAVQMLMLWIVLNPA